MRQGGGSGRRRQAGRRQQALGNPLHGAASSHSCSQLSGPLASVLLGTSTTFATSAWVPSTAKRGWARRSALFHPRSLLKMRSRVLLSLLVVGLLALGAAAEGDVDEKDVVILTDKNFEDKLKSAKYALGELRA